MNSAALGFTGTVIDAHNLNVMQSFPVENHWRFSSVVLSINSIAFIDFVSIFSNWERYPPLNNFECSNGRRKEQIIKQ